MNPSQGEWKTHRKNSSVSKKETKHFEEKWGEQMSKGDPYYNPNLSMKEADCSPERRLRNEVG